MHENESLHPTLLLFQYQPIIDLLARVTSEKRIIPQIKLYIKYNRTSQQPTTFLLSRVVLKKPSYPTFH